MAQSNSRSHSQDDSRCRKCHFWFERCCHALALLEGNNHSPCACQHFVTEHAPPHLMMEVSP